MKTKHATTNYKMIAPFIEAVEKAGGHRRFESGAYMPLSIENLCYEDYKGNPVYGMMHWTTMNGDLMRDPDMTFSVNRATGEILPMTYQNDFMGRYDEVFKEISGKLCYSKRLLTSLDEFLWTWLKNIKAQGFSPEEV